MPTPFKALGDILEIQISCSQAQWIVDTPEATLLRAVVTRLCIANTWPFIRFKNRPFCTRRAHKCCTTT